MKNSLLIIFLFVFIGSVSSQTYYYNSGDPAMLANWGDNPGGTGTNPSSFSGASFIIEGSKNAIVNSSWVLSNSQLIVNTGGILTANSSITLTTSIFQLDSAATYIHNNTANTITTVYAGNENFHPKSNVRIDNWFSTSFGMNAGVTYNAAQYYYGNLEINWTSCVSDWSMALGNIVLCANDFKVTSTGKGRLISGAIFNTMTITIKNYYQSGGEVDLSFGSTIVNGHAIILNIRGNFEKTGGVLDGNGASSFGMLYFTRGHLFIPDDTVHQTFYNSGTLRRVQIRLASNSKMRLLGNMPLTTNNSLCGFYNESQTVLDCGTYQVTGAGPFEWGFASTLKIGSPFGFKSGSSSGNIITTGTKTIHSTNTIEYVGTSAQVLGDSIASPFPCILKINNPSGVSLNKTIRLTNAVRFTNGKLNLGNYDLIAEQFLTINGINVNNFFNTNGTGYYKIYLMGNGQRDLFLGSRTFSPVRAQFVSASPDTFSFKVTDGFIPGALPPDSGYCVRKTWHIVDKNPGNTTAFFQFQWMQSDNGINYDYSQQNLIAKYESGVSKYTPMAANQSANFVNPPAPPVSISCYQSGFQPTAYTEDSYFIIGNNNGVYDTYYYNTGDASLLTSWKENQDGSGSSPSSFDYATFNVIQNKTAIFDSPVTFTNKTKLRAFGNGAITSNQPITNQGILELHDSSTYNHNNNSVAASTILSGSEMFSERSNYNILMWSDTAHKVYDGIDWVLGNLTINFNNLSRFGFPAWSGNAREFLCLGNFKYIQSSGYEFAPVGRGYVAHQTRIEGNLQIGDSVNFPDANPVLNLSGGTFISADSSAGFLSVKGNIDIQRGGITSQSFPVVAKGRIQFYGSKKHTFYCYQPFLWQTYSMGTANYPNYVHINDTLVLKSDFYNSQSGPFLFHDMWQIDGVMDLDTFSVRSTSIRVGPTGTLITRKQSGFRADLLPVQSVTFQEGSTFEYAGSGPQNYMSPGSREIKNPSNLKINNQSNVTLNIDSVTVLDTLILQSGKLITSSVNPIILPDDVRYRILNNNSFINGPAKVITESFAERIIPLGKGSNSRSIRLLPTMNNYTEWLVEYFNTGQSYGNSIEPTIESISNSEYVTIDRNGSAEAFVGLYWGPTSGVTNPAAMRVAKWNGSMWTNTGTFAYAGNNDSGYVYSNVVSSFSPFVLAKVPPPMPVNPNDLIISEFRLGGGNNVFDEFIEFYNTTDQAINVNTTDASQGWYLVTQDGNIRFTIPNGTIIPAKAHYLVTNSLGYSLNSYPAGNGTTATGDLTYASDIPQNTGMALFKSILSLDIDNRICATGFASSSSLYKEGTGLPDISVSIGNTIRSSFFRIETTGGPKNTENNLADYKFGDPDGTGTLAGQNLAAPGPENLSSPMNKGGGIVITFADPTLPIPSAPNFVRDFTSDPSNNSVFGTLDFHLKIKNQTAAPITRLRFRIAGLSTFPSPPGGADLRARTSSDILINVNGNAYACRGTTLETPPLQPNGGGLNSSMSVNSIYLAQPLAVNDSMFVRLLFGSQQNGNILVSFIAEALGEGSAGSEGTGSGISIPFMITGTDTSPLPVELASFTGTSIKNNVNLNWSTTMEINNSGFDIERRLGSDSVWHKIAFIQGAGNANQIKDYKYEDKNLTTGKYAYRLKQIDYNGNFTYYNLNSEIEVGVPNEFKLSQNYPNPFNPTTKIDFELPKESKVALQIFDITGRMIAVLVNNENYKAGYYTVQFNASSLASGTYFFRLAAGDYIQTKKMQLIK